MKKTIFLLFIVPALCITNTPSAKAQGGVTALVNAVETLQFLKDIRDNKGNLENTAKAVKGKYKESDSAYIVMRDKYAVVKLAADNILNNMVIDLMDRDKRKLFIDRPGIISDYYSENVQLYNNAVTDFKVSYLAITKSETSILNFLKNVANLLLGDLIQATKKIAIEILVEKLKAPYTMKSWREI